MSQQQPSGYHGVQCLKVNPGKGADYHKWYDEEGRKVMQATVDSGKLTTYYRLRAVAPAGTAATCDYLGVTLFPAFPEEPLAGAQLEALVKKAGITGNAQDFVDRRESFAANATAKITRGMFIVRPPGLGSPPALRHLQDSSFEAPLGICLGRPP